MCIQILKIHILWMGKTCEPKAFSFQCMTKFTTNKNPYLKSQTSSDTIVNVFKILLFKKIF